MVIVVHAVNRFVPCDPVTCWRVFTEASTLPAWIPGLRRAQVLAKAGGLPAEIHFEYAGSRVYTLVYTYDVALREVHWQPKLGKRAGVTGFARFEAVEGGTNMTYGLEQGDDRSDAERELGDVQVLVDAFAAWMADPRSRAGMVG
ncbi:MAG: hypothetical protein H6Q90_1523 [Deltaproteobacteria bacterium]|nr:hypothetical protein [Deltaproteobacteria bacterium]